MWLILHCRDCGDQQDILAEHLSTQRGSWFDQGDIGISIKGSAWCPCQTALHLHCGCVSATITVDILWQEGAFSTRNLKQAQWKANLEGDNGGEKLHVASFLIQLSHQLHVAIVHHPCCCFPLLPLLFFLSLKIHWLPGYLENVPVINIDAFRPQCFRF